MQNDLVIIRVKVDKYSAFVILHFFRNEIHCVGE